MKLRTLLSIVVLLCLLITVTASANPGTPANKDARLHANGLIAALPPASFDGGDAPLSYEGNGTTDLCTHDLTGPNTGLLFLGTTAPTDNAGNLKNVAAGADNTGSNGDGLEEDAITGTATGYFNSGTYILSATVTNNTGGNANLYAWVDWNNDGDFLDAGESASVVVANGATSATLTWTGVSDNLPPGVKYYVRLRLTTDVLTSPLGNATDGEVEDYYLNVVRITPDFTVTKVYTTASGDLSTNDEAPAGTTYGTPVADPGNPGAALPSVNSNGTYTFTTPARGIYYFYIPVCAPGQSSGCKSVELRIMVIQAGYVQPPIANTDIASTKMDQFVSIATAINDNHSYHGTNLNPASVTIVNAPAHASTSVFPSGNIAYVPNSGYTGNDTLTYSICDDGTPTPSCATAKQIIRVVPANADNTTDATDDYAPIVVNSVFSDNASLNDKDPEHDAQSTVVQNLTFPGKGTFALNNSGDYTFTPVSGYSGQLDIPYTTCDNGSPSACRTATIHILMVAPGAALPVKLESFTADLNDCAVTLNWKAASEINFKSYTVEYSKDGSHFTPVAVINGNGNNSKYSTTHKSPADGKAYYRLRMTDIDGHEDYSQTLSLSINCSRSYLKVFPTPVTDGKLHVNISTLDGKFDCKLFNLTGQLVAAKTITKGNNTIDVSKLTKGVYYLSLDVNGSRESFKVMVQ
ncbi:MAG: T9SS type A sorting domain-containing protein [Sphingobacteriales bacterium]|nr:T9SS type A sorting domain-containing protein [Sphingobacteriales bacterium]MBI3717141.1 T9SS type A sorting domain-containing protein [Sphingobacteriales bacterium]